MYGRAITLRVIRDSSFKVIRLANQETLQGLQKILAKAGTSIDREGRIEPSRPITFDPGHF
jgi:hypothetical protein